MSNVLFSVLVITYNQEKYIAQTLDSIINQKHGYSYEIVIGDDCSTDGTRKIIEDYVEKYPNIIQPIYNSTNLGAIENYFNVLQNCTGKYIMECAGDDWWYQNKVKSQIKFMESHNDIVMCYGKIKTWNEDEQKFGKVSGGKKQEFDELMMGNSVPAVTVCFRKEAAMKYFFDVKPLEQQWLMEDIPMWLYFSLFFRISFINKVFAYYRVLGESLSHSVNSEKQKKFDESCLEIRKYYAERYGRQEILNQYMFREQFNKAWNNKDRKSIVDYGIKLKTKSLIDCFKVCLAKNKVLMKFYILLKK